MRTFLIITIGTIVVLVAAVSLLMHFNPLCGEDVISEETSPDGRYVAVWMTRNCGAATSYFDHLNLRPAGAKFRPDFLNGTIKTDEVFGLDTKYGRLIRFDWLSPRKLAVEYLSSRPNSFRKDAWRDVSIEYPNQNQ